MSATASNKPWYCRKGRGQRERIEKLIAAKRERDARVAGINMKNHSYFSNWQRQTEWLTHTHQNACAPKSKTAPYDLDYEPSVDKPKPDASDKRSESAKKEMLEKYQQYLDVNKVSKKSVEEGDKLCYEIETLLTLKKTLKDKRENWDIRERKLYYNRFAKDKLRSKIFLLCEQLNYYKVIIECLAKSSTEKYMGKQETEQLNSLIQSSVNIINTFIRVNEKRNTELTQMYNEEAEKRWLNLESLWQGEKNVWYKIVDTVMETFFMILKYKLEENLVKQEENLQKNFQALQSLSSLVDQLRKDSELSYLLDADINELNIPKLTD